ncbi:hypothetical protein GW534_14185 [Bacillus sp. P1(2020)]|uniref:Uncharacterized protein n=2 Tax=Pallidibacillus pasinlerensis TaxID=2703818 RepID=A0ABX0A5W7_9BACI|nr:hypothetical protein [Pallidibacillus pasinlerensis]
MVSILYAFIVLIPIQLMGNVYRISRLTTWEIDTVNMLIAAIIIVDVIGGTILLLLLTRKWLGDRKANFWTVILWIPYFVLFTYLIASLFPITYGGDAPNPVTGLIALGGLIVYPVYILILNFLGFTTKNKKLNPA